MFCKTCYDKKTCIKVCEKVEKHLRQTCIYSVEWIRPQLPRNLVKGLKKQGITRHLKWREIPVSYIEKF